MLYSLRFFLFSPSSFLQGRSRRMWVCLRTFLSAHSAALETQQCYDAMVLPLEKTIYKEVEIMLPPNTPTFVFPFCVDANSLGNIIGMYYNGASVPR